ncbi:MAG: hypothetical protein A2V81_00590 [Candidatus Abawacabacteria bacterium RBG_16_42_10]|uniref:Phospholipid/glycerol acyltransferase domain-containing protein n=1 Tax=Candidatus Abawacabacteria bacterium RBG_16_42_10 TaxID=1817814 RepID=A0A1F4XKI4_9BACT|nr:MAG: hypothetical protein A2V81_00590 [Candidatus Abawacabacteria bacterium RBG_16_42_10]
MQTPYLHLSLYLHSLSSRIIILDSTAKTATLSSLIFIMPKGSSLSLRLKKKLERAITAPLPRPKTREGLERLSIPELYVILEDMVSRDTSMAKLIKDTIVSQYSFLYELIGAVMDVRGKHIDQFTAHHLTMARERKFLERLERAGVPLHTYTEVSEEDISEKPSLLLVTHQGGGWENYMSQGLTGIPCSFVIKGELMKIPFMSDAFRAKKVIPVDRHKISRSPEQRQLEIERIATEVAERLRNRENMLIFFEGTRSSDGEIAATPKRRAWAKDLLTAIDTAWEKNSWHDGIPSFQKLLLVVHTMTAMPDVPEKDVFLSRFRLNTPIAATLVKADGLWVEDSDDKYDPNTLFGKARTVLKKMLVEIILKQN